jgi:hypothetical protein
MYPKPQKPEKRRSKVPKAKNSSDQSVNNQEIKIMKLKLTEPKVVTFWIAVALALLGVLASAGIISGLASYAFWLVVAGFVLLALANLVKDL